MYYVGVPCDTIKDRELRPYIVSLLTRPQMNNNTINLMHNIKQHDNRSDECVRVLPLS